MSIKLAARLMASFALFCLLGSFSSAQSTAQDSSSSQQQPPAQGQATPSIQPEPKPAQQEPKTEEHGKPSVEAPGASPGTSKDRLFYTLPNFLSLETTAHLPPLTAKQKFAVVARGTFDYVEYPWWGLLAAISQAENSEPAFGQGWGAYAKRYGTTAGDSMVENFMVGAVYPSLFRQDPRFYQTSQGSFTHRMLYSVSRIFVTRSDSGKSQFNFSEILGSASGAAISTYTYHPRSTYLSTPSNPHLFVASDRTLSNAADVWYTQVTLDAITIVVKEFWPDIHRKLAHKPTKTAIDGTDPHSAPIPSTSAETH